MRFGIKYCGGCNPRYDRMEVASRLREEFPGVEIGPARPGDDLVAVVCGCAVACADHRSLSGSAGKVILTRAGDYAALRELALRAIADTASRAGDYAALRELALRAIADTASRAAGETPPFASADNVPHVPEDATTRDPAFRTAEDTTSRVTEDTTSNATGNKE